MGRANSVTPKHDVMCFNKAISDMMMEHAKKKKLSSAKGKKSHRRRRHLRIHNPHILRIQSAQSKQIKMKQGFVLFSQ